MNIKKLILIIGLGLIGMVADATDTSNSQQSDDIIVNITNPKAYVRELQLGASYAEFNKQFKQHNTSLLIVAARMGHQPLVTAILKKIPKEELNVQNADEQQHSALHYAVEGGHRKITQQLIAAGASTELTNAWGHTAFIIAAIGGHLAIAMDLKNNGAKIQHKTIAGRGALSYALACQQSYMARWLQEECKLTLTDTEKQSLKSVNPKLIDCFIQKYGVSPEAWRSQNEIEALIHEHTNATIQSKPKKAARKRSAKELAQKKQKTEAKRAEKLKTERAHRAAESAHDTAIARAAQVTQKLAAQQEYEQDLARERTRLLLTRTLHAQVDKAVQRDLHVTAHYNEQQAINDAMSTMLEEIEDQGFQQRLDEIFMPVTIPIKLKYALALGDS